MNAGAEERRAWGWVAHLRGGGTTPWLRWAGEGEPDGRYLPGAQHLELLRRLNGRGRVEARLAERVLTAVPPGRGRPELGLVGLEQPQRFGPPPVDPALLRPAELLRVAAGLLAEDVVRDGASYSAPTRRPRFRRMQYVLAGDPWIKGAATAALLADGRPPGGRDAVVAVVGTDLGTMLADVWCARAFADGTTPWPRFWTGMRERDAPPPRVDLPTVADLWAGRVGRARMRIVLDPSRLGGVVGVRRPLADAPVLAGHAVELARRIGRSLAPLVPPARRKELLVGVLLPRLTAVPGEPLGVPPEHADWVVERGARMCSALLERNYPVLGDAAILRRPPRLLDPHELSDSAVLDLAVDLLLGRERS